MAFTFSEKAEQRFQDVLTRYPEENRRAALLPTLFIAQEDRPDHSLDVEAMRYVAGRLGLAESQVLAVATFYTLYNKRPVGRHHVQVCVSISCAIRGAHALLHYLEAKLGVRVGETTKDGRFTLSEVECLASCGTAPMMQINDDYHEDLRDKAAVDRLIDALVSGAGASGPSA